MKIVETNKLLLLFCIFIILISCNRKDNPQETIQTKEKKENLNKAVAADINSDGVTDTVSLQAYQDVGSSHLLLKIKYSTGKKITEKIFFLEDSMNAQKWGLEAKANWISLGFTESHFGYFAELYFNDDLTDLNLRTSYKIDFKNTIKTQHKVFDNGSLSVETIGMKVCRDLNTKIVVDTLFLNTINSDECMEIPYFSDDSGRTEGGVLTILNLVNLENIK